MGFRTDHRKRRIFCQLGIGIILTTLAAGAGLGALQSSEKQAMDSGQRQNIQDATAAIKQLIAKYAAAVNAEPVDIHLASRVWLNSPDVSLIVLPLGEEKGWDEIKRNFYENIMEGQFSKRKLTPGNIQVHTDGNCGWAEFSWRFVATFRKDGSRVETNGRETQIYKKLGPRRWVLVHVHYSAMPSHTP